MKINILENESRLLGYTVASIQNWDSVDEVSKAGFKLASEGRAYVYCQVDAMDIQSIHQLEKAGFCFSEFRIHTSLNTGDANVSTRSFFPYQADLIGDEDQIAVAVEILKSTHDDDRFSCDPLICKTFSKERVVENLMKSFRSYPDEFVLGLFNTHTDQLVAFRSGAFISPTEVHYYQFGIAAAYDLDHTANMLESFTIELLKSRGVQIISAVSTGFNINELNRLIKYNDFKINSSAVIMRKIFK